VTIDWNDLDIPWVILYLGHDIIVFMSIKRVEIIMVLKKILENRAFISQEQIDCLMQDSNSYIPVHDT